LFETGKNYFQKSCREKKSFRYLSLYIMQLMDGLRKNWGVRYPMD